MNTKKSVHYSTMLSLVKIKKVLIHSKAYTEDAGSENLGA